MGSFIEVQTDETYRAKLLDKKLLTAPDDPNEVYRLTLSVDLEMGLLAGIHVGVRVPDPNPDVVDPQERLYTVVDAEDLEEHTEFSLCVRRCSLFGPEGEVQFKGLVSHYLCDLRPGQEIVLAGPYGAPFVLPGDSTSNLVMIVQGTGVAAFRTLMGELTDRDETWLGQVHILFGPMNGVEQADNEKCQKDFLRFQDAEGFEVFQQLLDRTQALYVDQKVCLWELLQDPHTYLYIAGLSDMVTALEKGLAQIAGSEEDWIQCKATLQKGRRWQELLY